MVFKIGDHLQAIDLYEEAISASIHQVSLFFQSLPHVFSPLFLLIDFSSPISTPTKTIKATKTKIIFCGVCGLLQALLHEEALACELAADFYARRKRHLLVYDYLKEGTVLFAFFCCCVQRDVGLAISWSCAGEVDVISAKSE